MNGTALVLTVGGSHEPLLRAIENVKPLFVLFICSDDDVATKRKGSYSQILGNGLCTKSKPSDDKATLENIPRQVGLAEDHFDIVKVPADDLDEIYPVIAAQLNELCAKYDGVICNYTGGTKTMSGALLLAAVDNSRVQLQLVTGARANLDKVASGAGRAVIANVDHIRFRKGFDRALSCWRDFSYGAARVHLSALGAGNRDDRGLQDCAEECSRAFAAWDVFDHRAARLALEPYMSRFGEPLARYMAQLQQLCSNDPNKRDAACILDLWNNAQRCGARGRFDDATSRVYRLLEWSAQWQLRHHCNGVSTAAIPAELIPERMELEESKGEKGKYQAGLMKAWEIASHHCGEASTKFWAEHAGTVRDLISIRNNSVLAHGYQPITEPEWRRLAEFSGSKLLPFMLVQFGAVKINKLPAQLPDCWIGV